ncbi:MAG: NADH-dependent [FeFe] hydrogenase, group A6 [Clostridia bacterium]
MINLTVNGKQIATDENNTILEAAREHNIMIPTLCFLEGVHQLGSCRLCVVEVEGFKNLVASCITKAGEGMVVRTHTKRVIQARKILYELIMSDHNQNCLSCSRNQNCELQAIGETIQADDDRFTGEKSKAVTDRSSPSIVRNSDKCILCRRCVTICNEVQGVGIMYPQGRGFKTEISSGEDLPLNEVACTFCGQCTTVCPVNALSENESIEAVQEAIADPRKTVIVQTAPAIRAALGEEFGLEPGTIVTGRMASALHELGFDYVFDTNFAADLTILEEGSEFLKRAREALLENKKPLLPMITSCSPGWIKYIEHYYNDFLGHLSSCKSPHMMLGALCKSYFAKKINVDPKDMFVVSIMPCTAKKFEITRPEMTNNGVPNVDAVLTTRELGKMVRQAGLDFKKLPEKSFDSPMGLSSGAADIFGTTGGVMEAALRTIYEIVTGRELPFEQLHVQPVMGLERIKTTSVTIEGAKEEFGFLNGVTLNLAVTNGLSAAKILLEEIKEGKSPYHFIEIMACPGGCINGGGQPRPSTPEKRKARMEALYREDEGKGLRKSHENADLKKLYGEFLGEPLGHLSHELLHTTYTKRG